MKNKLEDLITSPDYKKANSLNAILEAAANYLMKLADDPICKKLIFSDYNLSNKTVGISFKDIKDRLLADVKRIKVEFLHMIFAYEHGNYLNSIELLKKILVINGALILDQVILKDHTSLFRMRSQNGYKLYNRNEMFHIPNNVRDNISNYRYNVNGYPCLYLGQSLCVCWEEIRRADIDTVNYVKMMPITAMKFFAIQCPTKISQDSDIIRFFVFALCTKTADNDEKSFKYQYVIPEMVLQLFISLKAKNNFGEIWGIRYISARYFDLDNNYSPQTIYYNYVMPTQDFDKNDGLCNKLKQQFKVSEVKAYFIKRIFENTWSINRQKQKGVKYNNYFRPNSYKGSFFEQLENELVADKLLP